MNTYPQVTIIVPTYNRSYFIERAFTALLRQNYPPDKLEIIAVDDGSTDSTREILARLQNEYPAFRYLAQANRGPAAARNLALRRARGEIILFTDDDCIADQNWVRELARGYEHPAVGGVAGQIRYVPPGNNLANAIAAHANGKGQPLNDRGEIAFFITANASFRRAALEQTGGFDAVFPHAAHEDLDLSDRVRQAGWQLRYADSALVHHHHHYTFKGNLKKWCQIGNAQAIYQLKRGAPTSVCTALARSLVALLRIPFGFIKHLTRGKGLTVSLMLPLTHRLHDLTIALGMIRGYASYRAVFKKQPTINDQSQHAVIQQLLRTQIEEHFAGRVLPVYGDDPTAKLGRIQLDIERMLLTLATIRRHFADPAGIKVLELGANPYFLTSLIQSQLGAEVQTNGAPLGITAADGQEVRAGTVVFTNLDDGSRRVIENRLFNVEENKFPYAGARFDLVICQELIEHLLFSPTAMLNEIHRVLKPGGRVIISCPNIARIDVLRRVLANKNPVWGYIKTTLPPERAAADWPTRHGVYGRHNREFTLAELEDLARGCGFRVRAAGCVSFQMPKIELKLFQPALFFRTLVYWLMKAVTYLPIHFLQAKKDTVFLVAEKDRDEPIAYYPPSLYGAWQVQAVADNDQSV